MICSQYPTRHVIRHVSKWYETYPVHASGRMSRDVVKQKEAVRAGSEHVRVRAVQSLISFIIVMESEVISGMCGSAVYSLLETSGTKERESASLTGRNLLGIPVTPRLINAVPPSEQLEEQPLLTCVYVNVRAAPQFLHYRTKQCHRPIYCLFKVASLVHQTGAVKTRARPVIGRRLSPRSSAYYRSVALYQPAEGTTDEETRRERLRCDD